MEIPPHVKIRATITTGSVYYFTTEKFISKDPHYFIVLNRNPVTDTIVVLVCIQSDKDNVKRIRDGCPKETLVEITPAQYSELKWDSIIDCNYILEISIDQMVAKLSEGTLKLKKELTADIVECLKKGVLGSDVVADDIKALL